MSWQTPWRLFTADWNFWPDHLSVEQVFETATRLGFDGIELGVYDPEVELAPGRLEALRRLSAAHRLQVAGVLYSLPPSHWRSGCLASSDSRSRQRAITHAIEIAKRVQEFGIDLLGLWLGGDRMKIVDDHAAAWSRLTEGMREIADALASQHQRIAFEYKPGEIVGNADAASRLFDQVNRSNVGLLLDTGHAIYGREDLVDVLKKCGDRLFYIHLDDNYADYDRDLPPGAVHNFAPFFRELRAQNFRGAISLDLYYYMAEEGVTGEQACRESREYLLPLWAALETNPA
jgi:sugar phosphate isomerase/epimerase